MASSASLHPQQFQNIQNIQRRLGLGLSVDAESYEYDDGWPEAQEQEQEQEQESKFRARIYGGTAAGETEAAADQYDAQTAERQQKLEMLRHARSQLIPIDPN
eukprot:SAG31_NODE_628_length_13432_cov_131.456086_4_plen_103_part_00